MPYSSKYSAQLTFSTGTYAFIGAAVSHNRSTSTLPGVKGAADAAAKRAATRAATSRGDDI
jgi:hypothetical protein